MTTPILSITELVLGQIDQFLTANAAFRALEAAGNDFMSVNLASGNVTLSSTQFAGAALFRATGNTVARTLTVPASKRLFVVQNTGSYPLGVVRGSTTISVAVDQAQLLYTDGTTNGLVTLAGGGSGGGSLNVVEEGGTSRTLTLSDSGVYLRCTNAGAVEVTVPPASSQAWQVGDQIHIRQVGAGTLEIVEGLGVVVTPPPGATLMMGGDGATATLIYAGSDTWDLMGLLGAAP